MKILLACEESQAVCIELRKRGHKAFSCDLLPCSGGYPEWHIQDDVRNVLRRDNTMIHRCEYDMVIAFPPCTDLAVSGARWFKEKQADGRQQKSIQFFEFFTMLKNEYIAIENPIGIMSSLYRKPDQIIQPWQFGHGETKATCLWLKGLPKLNPANIVTGREQRIWKMSPGPERTKLRSKTFPGIASAMAEQWG
jgi:site-specific DNA-cytosine methylase